MTIWPRDLERRQLNWTSIQRTLSLPANGVSLQNQLNQENQNLNEKNYHSAFKTIYLRVYQTRKKPYDSRVTESWAWTIELNSSTQSSLDPSS